MRREKMSSKILYSFDIFDTVITRTTATPYGIFTIMERKLCTLPDYSQIHPHIRENFGQLRVSAEKMARMYFKEKEEITLEQIYEALGTTGELTDNQKRDLMTLEILTEKENIIPIPQMVNRIRSLLEDGERVIFISDMYLDRETIRNLLECTGVNFRDIPLYISCDYGKTKSRGNLYNTVRDIEKVTFNNWIHSGDNFYSDVQKARSLGINARHCEFTKLTLYENNLLKQNANDPVVQLSVGAARNTRLVNSVNYQMEFGCSIGGPMIFGYVNWIIERCIEMGLYYLYFVARDGYVLKKIADLIISSKGIDIQTKYIYGSRSAWRIPSLTQDNFNIDFVFDEAWALTDINSLAATIGLETAELAQFLPEKYSNGYHELSSKEIVEIRGILCNSSEFRDFLCEKIQPRRWLVKEYLKQEINWQEDNFAFIELRGTGRTIQCMADIVFDFWKTPIKSFYLELLEISKKSNCIQYNWLPSSLYLAQTVETLCRATHGQTLGYKEMEGFIMPVLEDGEGETLQKYGYNDYINGVMQYTERFAKSLLKNNLYINSPKIFIKYLDYLTQTPDQKMLDFIGDMPFEGRSVSGTKSVGKFAPVLTQEDIERIYGNKTNERRSLVYAGSALEISEMRISPELHEYMSQLKIDKERSKL